MNLSCEYLGDDASASDFGVGEPLRAAVVGEIQASVIEAHLMQDCGVQVRDADAVLDGLVAKLIGGSMNVPRLEAAARHQQTESMTIVVAAIGSLGDRQASELARPLDNDIVQQPALF